MEPTFFRSPAELRRWLGRHHGDTRELWIGFHKKGSGKAGISYAEALDEALCHGWIDGLTKGIDASSFTIRFSPRKARSSWSVVNMRRAEELVKLGRMRPPGLKAYAERDPARSGVYSYEQRAQPFDSGQHARFEKHAAAWTFFQSQPASYRRAATWWVRSAKREETRVRRLEALIEVSAEALRLPSLARPQTALRRSERS